MLEDVVSGRRDAAASRRLRALRCDEVSVPALECSNGNSDWWYMYTSTMLINNGDPCVQRECAAETACCDHANLCALRVRCTKIVIARTRFGSYLLSISVSEAEAWIPDRADSSLHIYLGFCALAAVWKGTRLHGD